MLKDALFLLVMLSLCFLSELEGWIEHDNGTTETRITSRVADYASK